MNNNKIRLQRFISSSIAVLLFAAIALGAALPAAASTAASFAADFAETQTGRAADNLRSNDEREFSSGIPMDANGIPMTADGVPKLKRDVRRSVNSDFSFINVKLSVGETASVRLELCGAYYVAENMRAVVGSESSPRTAAVTVEDGKITLSSGGSTVYRGSEITLMRVNYNESAGWLQLFCSGNANERKYLGNLVFRINDDGTLRVINHIPTAHYLYGIVPYEMSESCPIESLKCQAVASRTYAFGFTMPGDDYDITDSFNYQGYRGYKPGYEKCMRACVETTGVILSVDNEIPLAFYGATNGGETALPSHLFGYDSLDPLYEIRLDDIDFYEANPAYRQNLEITYGEISDNEAFNALLCREAKKIVGSSVRLISILETDVNTPKFENCERNMANVDVRILVGTGSGEQEVSFGFSADRLKAEGVFTKNYKMYWGEPTSTGYNIYFCRYGHGLGMSQYGAQARAREGQTYQQVLKFYYGKMKLTDVCELNPERPFAYSLNIKAYGEFNTTNVNLRSGPSASFTSLGKFNTGTHVDVINAVNGWICCIADGKLGYVRGDYIDVKLFPSPIAAQQRVCEAKTTEAAALRTSPSQYAAEIVSLSEGAQIRVWFEIGDWYYVRIGHRSGFVEKSKIIIGDWFIIDLHAIVSSQIGDGIRPRP